MKGNVTKRIGAPKGNKNALGNKGGAPRGSKNALGNRGGHGGPLGNKKAVTTGEFESIWLDALDHEERDLVDRISTAPLIQIDERIRILSIRESRMLMKIQNLKNGLTDKQRRVLQERISVKDVRIITDEKTGITKTIPITRDELTTTQIERQSSEQSKISDTGPEGISQG